MRASSCSQLPRHFLSIRERDPGLIKRELHNRRVLVAVRPVLENALLGAGLAANDAIALLPTVDVSGQITVPAGDGGASVNNNNDSGT